MKNARLFKIGGSKDSSAEKKSEIISKQKSQKSGSHRPKSKKSITSGIPKVLVTVNGKIKQDNFDYVQGSFEDWKKGKYLQKGTLWEAININTGVIAAIKQKDKTSQEQQSQRQLNIIKTLQEIKHPNIVEYYGHYQTEEKIYIVMEFIDLDLKKFYLKFGAPPIQQFFYIAKQILKAFELIHSKNIFHQDFKCENTLVDSKMTIKLCDFSLAKKFTSNESLVGDQQNFEQTSIQTCWWSPPQKLNGQHYDREKADIWSIGCTFLELISGKYPWSELDPKLQEFSTRHKIETHIIKSNKTPRLPKDCDEKVAKLISYCVQRDPKNRLSVRQILGKKELWQSKETISKRYQ